MSYEEIVLISLKDAKKKEIMDTIIQDQHNNTANSLHGIYNSYIRAGFSEQQAFQLAISVYSS